MSIRPTSGSRCLRPELMARLAVQPTGLRTGRRHDGQRRRWQWLADRDVEDRGVADDAAVLGAAVDGWGSPWVHKERLYPAVNSAVIPRRERRMNPLERTPSAAEGVGGYRKSVGALHCHDGEKRGAAGRRKLPLCLLKYYSGSRQKTARWLGTQGQITGNVRSKEGSLRSDFCMCILIAPTSRSGCTYRNRCGGFLL